jgi:hypothetical protein
MATLGNPLQGSPRATRTTLARGTDSAAERPGRECDSEADHLGVRLGVGSRHNLEGYRSRRRCYAQFILDIGVEFLLGIGIQ